MASRRSGTCVPAAFLALAVVGAFPAASLCDDSDRTHGDLTGRFLLEGEPPAPLRLKEAALCAGEAVLAESLVVDPKSRGIANVFVFLTSKDARRLTIPAELKESVIKERTLDQTGCVFVPHAMVLRSDQKVRVISNDPTTHNVHSYTLKNDPVNFLVPPGDRQGVLVRFTESEITPVPVKCDIHPWMQAWWLILDHPYAAVSDRQGTFRIKKLPAGTHSLRVWHEHAGYLERDWKITIDGGKTTDAGCVKFSLEKLAGKAD